MKRLLLVAKLFLAGSLLTLLLAISFNRPWKELQRLGHMPEDVNRSTREGERQWLLAERTTWWGKPLNPSEFWKGRVVWNDESARAAAHRYGRGYPPIPEHLPNLVAGFPLRSRSRAEKAASPWSGGPDGGRVVPYHYTDVEGAYWDWFWRTKPKPPPTLEREQIEVASEIRRIREEFMIGGRDLHASISGRKRSDAEQTQKRRAQEIGVPAEALTEEALFWVYNCPATEEERSTANKWKVAYLQRLRREKTDDSYLNAYLAAWKLKRAQVFEEETRK